MSIIKPKMVLLDVDGTLVDSVPDLSYCVDELMRILNREPHGEKKVRDWVGNGVEKLCKRALTGDMNGEPSEKDFDVAYPIFLDLYSKNTANRSCLYTGVIEGLEYLKSSGYNLGCVTNKAERFTLPLLKQLKLFDFFEIIISGDSLPNKKPDPEPLLHAAKFFQSNPNESLMIGDSKSDVKAARAAGFQIVCMSYGYNHGLDIRDSEPDMVIDSMKELISII